MTGTVQGDNAFPIYVEQDDFGNPINKDGLTKREYFAAIALQGLLASWRTYRTLGAAAVDAVAVADALIEELRDAS